MKKDDTDKVRLDLIPPTWLHELAEVLEAGAEKYGENNWMDPPYAQPTRTYGSAMRHLTAWALGDNFDDDTDCPHLVMAATQILMLHWQITQGGGKWEQPNSIETHSN